MQQHIYYIRFALRFADMQIQELVTVFNAQVFLRRLYAIREHCGEQFHDSMVLAMNSFPQILHFLLI